MNEDDYQPIIRKNKDYTGMSPDEIKEFKRIRTIEYNKSNYIRYRKRTDPIKDSYKDILYILNHNLNEEDLSIWSSLYICEETLNKSSGLKKEGYTWDSASSTMIKDPVIFKYEFQPSGIGVSRDALSRQNACNEVQW